MASSRPPNCVILGGGGHARVLIEAIQASRAAKPAAVLDNDETLWGREVLGVPIRGGDGLLPGLAKTRGTFFVVGLGGVGDNRPRKRLFELALRHGLKPLTVVHPSAVVSSHAVLGPGTAVLPLAVVNAGARTGANVIVNSGAIVEHDCSVGDHAHVATGASLASTVTVGNLAHVGAGAVVKQCQTIGEGAVVGAGAVVIGPVAPWTVVAGVPARVLRKS